MKQANLYPPKTFVTENFSKKEIWIARITD